MEGVEGGFWADLFRNIFGWVDSLIYGFIASVYNTFTNITNYTLINDEVLQTFNQRIYALIGIFMLFKLAFSLITYFISPDKFSDSKSGFGNLIQRVIISLVLLVLVPSIFNLAFRAQTYILRENIIANLILGGQYDNFDIKERQEMYANAGKNMAFTTLSAFMHPYDQNVLSMDKDELKKEYADDPDAVTHFETYRTAVKENDINALVGWYKLNTKEDIDGYYLFSYTPLLSTVAGIMVLWILIVFCIDIGIRTVKLTFLQLIAPIPVIGYIDANKGEKTFTSWVKECLSTYAEVFLKLLAIYFVIFLITLITKYGFFQYVIDENNQLNTVKVENPDFFAMALIIIGLLIFAQQVPKLIGDLFGIKTGDFSLNPMKKIGQSPLAAAAVGGIAGGAAGLAANAWNLGRNIQKKGVKESLVGDRWDRNYGSRIKNAIGKTAAIGYGIRRLSSPFGGMFSTAGRATVSGLKGNGKVLGKNVISSKNAAVSKRETRQMYQDNGIGLRQRATDSIDRFAKFKNKEAGYGLADAKVNKLKEELDNVRHDESGFREARTMWASENTIPISELERASKLKEGTFDFEYKDYQAYRNAYDNDQSANKKTALTEQQFNDDRSKFSDNIRELNKKQQEIENDIRDNEKIVKAQNKDK